MAKVSDLKDSKFLTKEDCGENGIAVTIVGWRETDVSMESEPTKIKYVLDFQETDKPLVLNNTNGQRIEAITNSDDFDDWKGQRITLFNDKTVSFGGKTVGGIRVYVPQQAPAAAQQPDITNPGYVGDDPPPPTDDNIPY